MFPVLTKATLLLACLCVGFGAPAGEPRRTEVPLTTTNAAVTATSTAIPQSIFVIPASDKEGRNPFFPHAHHSQPVAKAKSKGPGVSSIVLNGLTGPPKRTAMINGHTFETGETGEIRLPEGGKVQVECLEIRDDAAVVLIANERRELRLRQSL